MGKRIVSSAIAESLFGAATVLAQGLPSRPATFFVIRAPVGMENFWGFSGADELCQTVAEAADTEKHFWHAQINPISGAFNRNRTLRANDVNYCYYA